MRNKHIINPYEEVVNICRDLEVWRQLFSRHLSNLFRGRAGGRACNFLGVFWGLKITVTSLHSTYLNKKHAYHKWSLNENSLGSWLLNAFWYITEMQTGVLVKERRLLTTFIEHCLFFVSFPLDHLLILLFFISNQIPLLDRSPFYHRTMMH